MRRFRIGGVFLSVLLVLSFLILGFSFSEKKHSSSSDRVTWVWDNDWLRYVPSAGNTFLLDPGQDKSMCTLDKVNETFADFCSSPSTLVEYWVATNFNDPFPFCIEETAADKLKRTRYKCDDVCKEDLSGIGLCLTLETVPSPVGIPVKAGNCYCTGYRYNDFDGDRPGTPACTEIYFGGNCISGENYGADFCGADGSLYEQIALDTEGEGSSCGIAMTQKKYHCDSWCESQEGYDYGICSDAEVDCGDSFFTETASFCECFVE